MGDDVQREPARDPQDLERLLITDSGWESFKAWRHFTSKTRSSTLATGK
jgi:hypothetical protein